MTLPLQMTLRGASYSPALAEAARKRADALQQIARDVQYVRIVYQAQKRRYGAQSGGDMMLMVGVPGDCIVTHQRCHAGAGEPYTGLHKVFEQAERALVGRRRRALRHSGARIAERLRVATA